MTPQKPSSSRTEIHPLSIIRILWKKKILTVVTWLLGSAITAAVVSRLPAIYTSEATILVDSQKIPERFVTSTVNTELQDRISTITQQILSSAQMKKIIDDYNLYPQDRKRLVQEEILEKMRSDITITYVKGWARDRPGAFKVGYQGPSPDVIAQVTNRIAQLYIDENLKTREVQAEGTAEFMSTLLEDAKKRLEELEAAVSEYKVKHNGELPEQAASLSGRLARLDGEMQSNREAIQRDQANITTLESSLVVAEAALAAASAPRPVVAAQEPASPSNPNPVAPSSVRAPVRAATRAETLRAQIDGLLAHHTEEYPDVKRLRVELDAENKLEARQAAAAAIAAAIPVPVPPSAKPTPGDDPARLGRPVPPTPKEAGEVVAARERVASLQTQIAAAHKDIDARTADEPRISHEISELQNRLEGLPIREQEMAKLNRDYEVSKANYKSLEDKKIAADMATDMENRQKSERFTILNPAAVPEKPIKPNRPLMNIVGSAASFILGLLLAVSLEMRHNTLLGEWELPRGTFVLGRLPYIDLSKALPQDKEGGRRTWKGWRRAVVFSAALACLGVLAGVFVFWRRS